MKRKFSPTEYNSLRLPEYSSTDIKCACII